MVWIDDDSLMIIIEKHSETQNYMGQVVVKAILMIGKIIDCLYLIREKKN